MARKIVMFLVVVALASTVVSFGCTKATSPDQAEPTAQEDTAPEKAAAPAEEVKKEDIEVQGAAVEEVKEEGDKEVVEGEAVEEVNEVPEKSE